MEGEVAGAVSRFGAKDGDAVGRQRSAGFVEQELVN